MKPLASLLGSASAEDNNHNSNLSEKAGKPAAFLQSSLNSVPSHNSMESLSNRIASSTSASGRSAFEDEGSGGLNSSSGGVIVLTLSSRLRALSLSNWSLSDVVEVLKVNGCAVYASLFTKKVSKLLFMQCSYLLLFFCTPHLHTLSHIPMHYSG